MQTCRSCLANDLPDGATRCRHCGRRLKPSRAPVIITLVVFGVGGLLVLGVWTNSAIDRETARTQAHIEIDSLKAVHCTPDIAEQFERVNTERFESELEKSTLNLEEKQMLLAQFHNGMELSDCGFNARNKIKPSRKRR